jgi:CubicO group peptidase (beta-lactamase class C family)
MTGMRRGSVSKAMDAAPPMVNLARWVAQCAHLVHAAEVSISMKSGACSERRLVVGPGLQEPGAADVACGAPAPAGRSAGFAKPALTRRGFLICSLIGAYSPSILVKAGDQPSVSGILDSFKWGERPIPASAAGLPSNSAIDKAVMDAMRKYGIVGCGICVVRGDAEVYGQGFGYAELPTRPFLATTATRCGSLAKPVTALSALILSDQGKLDLDAEVLSILKEAGIVPRPLRGFKMDDRISRIKVRHLMDHTSGLPGRTAYTAWRPGLNVAARQGLDHVATGADVVADGLGNTLLDSDPGANYQYANANFVILARVIEARGKMPFNGYLTRVAMPKFGLKPDEIYVSRNQLGPDSPQRGQNEAAYYQTSKDRFVSFVPSERSQGRIHGEAYRGYTTEASDGGGGIACTALALGRMVANLHSDKPALSKAAMSEILTPPAHYARERDFNPASSTFYSKGFNVRFSGGQPWFAHGGMTQHCGGIIGHHSGCQYVVVSNWNNADNPYVDAILGRALNDAASRPG